MKKIISVVLLLALCIGCFAGCAPKEDAALNAAAEYLYAMYKDSKATTDSNYTVVSQVRIDDVIYPITWTADAAENVKITAGENNMTTVEITAGETDVNYKLTATLKNEDGQEVSVSFDHIIPAKAQVGGTIVLSYPKENKFISGSHYLYEAKNKWELNLTDNKAEAIALEVVDNGDDTVSFKAGEYYLFCDATSVKFVKEQDDNTKFVLEAADTDGGYFIKCAVANYNGKAQYLEVYSGYLTCYGMGSDPSIYLFKLEEATGAAGTISGLDAAAPEETPEPSAPPATEPPATEPPATEPPATEPPATNPPATEPPATVGNALVFDFSSLTEKGTEITEGALELFNGAANGSGLTAVTLTKIYNGNGTGGAFPETAGFLKCGTSKVDGAMELTFSKKAAKVEIVCHDWYTKSDKHPTNSNTIAVNGGAAQLAPYTADATMGTLTFALDTASETVSIAMDNTGSSFGRVFISKITVTFA